MQLGCLTRFSRLVIKTLSYSITNVAAASESELFILSDCLTLNQDLIVDLVSELTKKILIEISNGGQQCTLCDVIRLVGGMCRLLGCT